LDKGKSILFQAVRSVIYRAVKLEQPLNAKLLTDVMVLGNWIEVKAEQPLNAIVPIEVAPSGKVTEVIFALIKAKSPIDVTPEGMTRSVTCSPFRYKSAPHQRGFE